MGEQRWDGQKRLIRQFEPRPDDPVKLCRPALARRRIRSTDLFDLDHRDSRRRDGPA
jgi:hypothetical protein